MYCLLTSFAVSSEDFCNLNPRAYNPNSFGTDTVYVVAQPASDTSMVIFSSIFYLLPLELISFTAKEVNKKSQLSWLIESPGNVFGYEVQRSFSSPSGNTPWKSIGFVSHSNSRFAYNFIDNLPLDGINYYRLKIIDFDSKFEWSPVVSIKLENIEHHSINIFPNPVMSHHTLSISIDLETINDVNVQIFNLTGQPIKEYNYTSGNQKRFPIDINSFSNSFYIAKISVGDPLFEKSFVILSD